MCILTKNKTKLKKILNLNHRLNKMENKFTNIQTVLDFLSTLVLRDQSKWRANKNEHSEGDNPHLKVRCESKK